ncbi:hypothetical protein ABID95_004294 [Streptomyces atratus]
MAGERRDLAFTTAGNNFELAAAIATFGVTSGQALSGLVGSSSKFPAPHRSRLRPPDLLTGGLFHRLTTVRTEDFDEDAATVAFHDPARYADGCATHPIPAGARLFLRAAACFATLTDGFWPAKATGLSCYASPRAPDLRHPSFWLLSRSSQAASCGTGKKQRSRTLRATDRPSPQTGVLVWLEHAQRLVTAVSRRRTVSRWRCRRTRP